MGFASNACYLAYVVSRESTVKLRLSREQSVSLQVNRFVYCVYHVFCLENQLSGCRISFSLVKNRPVRNPHHDQRDLGSGIPICYNDSQDAPPLWRFYGQDVAPQDQWMDRRIKPTRA